MAHARQIAAASGVLPFVLLLIAALALGGNQPGPIDSVESVRTYITNHWFAIHVHHTSLGLAYLSALWFATFLWSILRQAEGDIGLFSALALIGAAVAVTVEFAVLALHSATFVEMANTVALRGFATASFRELVILELFPWATFFAAVAAVALTRGALPVWLGWSSAAMAVIELAGGIYSGLAGVNAGTTSGPFGPALALVYLPTLWLAAASVVLFRRELVGRAIVRSAHGGD